tara:strand:+ start:273 stop:1292 length:1020 start_codon:yes stop_codon:yes gene_type:complete
MSLYGPNIDMLLSSISDSTVSNNLLDLIVPEIKKSFMENAPEYGDLKSNKNFEDLIDTVVTNELSEKNIKENNTLLDLTKYQYNDDLLKKFVKNAEPALIDFVKQQNKYGGNEKRSINDILDRISDKSLKAYALPDDVYEKVHGEESASSSGGFHREGNDGGSSEIYLSGLYGNRGIGHEIGHELFGHQSENDSSVGKMSFYNKLDRLLKGWLPSFSKYSERPKSTSIDNTKRRKSGYKKFEDRKQYNKRMKAGKYNPKFADAPFDFLEEAMWNLQDEATKNAMMSNVLNSVKTKGGNYNVYDKRSLKAKDFRNAFKEARQIGLDIFEWDGKKYSTNLK